MQRPDALWWMCLRLASQAKLWLRRRVPASKLKSVSTREVATRLAIRVMENPKASKHYAPRWVRRCLGQEIRETFGQRRVHDALDLRWRELDQRYPEWRVESDPTLCEMLEGLHLDERDEELVSLFATGASHAEVAEAMGLTRDGVYKRVNRLRARWGQRLLRNMGLKEGDLRAPKLDKTLMPKLPPIREPFRDPDRRLTKRKAAGA